MIRLPGSFFISAPMTSASGPALGLGTFPLTTLPTVSSGSPSASYGGAPSTAANSVAPRPQRSAAGMTAPPEATSGAM